MDPQDLNKVFDTLVSNCPSLEKVCETWGNQHMLTIAMEENAELIQAISKIKRNGLDPINASHLDEEVADVYEIAEIIKSKVGRSMKRTQDYIKDLEEEARCDGSF